jgi:hypothetical protein
MKLVNHKTSLIENKPDPIYAKQNALHGIGFS